MVPRKQPAHHPAHFPDPQIAAAHLGHDLNEAVVELVLDRINDLDIDRQREGLPVSLERLGSVEQPAHYGVASQVSVIVLTHLTRSVPVRLSIIGFWRT
jgi:hypothetical protein